MKLSLVQAGLRTLNTVLLLITLFLIASGLDYCDLEPAGKAQKCESLEITQWSTHEGLHGQFLVVIGLMILTSLSVASVAAAFHDQQLLNRFVVFYNVIASVATVAIFCAELYYATCPWEEMPSTVEIAGRTGSICIVRSWAVASFTSLLLTVLSVVDMVVHWRRILERQAAERRNRTRKLTFDERLELDKEHFMEFSRKVSTRLPLAELPASRKLTSR
uniref:Uncharacterized protein n=1 Tax=Plectus sambesii TaxID=2011161 RepID=A0A914VFV6_9BILA